MYRLLLSFLLLIVLLGISCTNRSEFPSGYELLDRQNKGEVRQVTVFPVADGEKQFRVETTAGRRNDLYIGKYKDYNAWSILRFVLLPDSPKVETAQLILKNLSSKGEGASFTATIHEITTSWDENNVVWSDIVNAYDPNGIGSVEVAPSDSNSLVIDVDTGLVNSWIDSSVSNNGLLFKHQGADFLQEFGSSDHGSKSYFPVLKLVITEDSGPDTLEVPATYDATLFEYLGPEPIEELLPADPVLRIGNASGFRTLLRFDLDEISKDATIHRGLLALHINQDLSETESVGINYGIYPVVSDTLWNPETIKTDSLVQIPLGISAGDHETLGQLDGSHSENFASILQSWVSGKSPNYGMMIRSIVHGQNTSYLSFFTSSAPDSALAPKLIVTYSVPPSPRFK